RRQVLRAARAAGASPRRAPTSPAAARYTGVLYQELAWSTLPAGARRRGDRQVRIVSGLWGLVAPPDPIPPYRLKMSASLADLGRLSTWWRPTLAPVVADLVQGRTVWDLLPQEHEAAMDWSASSPRQRVTVRFEDADGRTVTHWNKLLKGSLVRWLLLTQPAGPGDLAAFRHPLGYRLDRRASHLHDEVATAVLRAAS
ncbi:MAG: peroxide stress protein YaaA, partial [Acidimicrobiales bacterium]|nr:peroxide stress protein YaaA [Acidimicrobiales bacterium]